MTIANFEKSGAAYVVYAACRARSVLRRHGRKPMRAEEIKEFALDQGEVNLRLNIQLLPRKIAMAARQANPSLLVHHMLDVAKIYNSYYMRAPVIVNGVERPRRAEVSAGGLHFFSHH
jgi:arginyl-tRNA synthetase